MSRLKILKFQKLQYRIINFSSEDPQYPLSNIIEQNVRGWFSNKFCFYP